MVNDLTQAERVEIAVPERILMLLRDALSHTPEGDYEVLAAYVRAAYELGYMQALVEKEGVMWTLRCGHEVWWYKGTKSPPPETLWCHECRNRERTA